MKTSISHCLVLILFLAAPFLFTGFEEMNYPLTPFPCKLIGNIDRVNFNEPSGIVFHPGRDTLFVVGAEGDICEIRKDGTMLKQKRILDADFEGITRVIL